MLIEISKGPEPALVMGPELPTRTVQFSSIPLSARRSPGAVVQDLSHPIESSADNRSAERGEAENQARKVAMNAVIRNRGDIESCGS
jgi:hypothetical protein